MKNCFNYLSLLALALVFLSCRSSTTSSYEPDTGNSVTSLVSFHSPEEGENWKPGTTHQIQWSFSREVEKINIYLYRKDQLKLTIAEDIDNKNQFEWTVPNVIDYSHHYRISVVDRLQKETGNFSNYFFIIGGAKN